MKPRAPAAVVRISTAEPITAMRRVPILECGEPLADFRETCPRLLLDDPRFRYRRETLLRADVARRLCEANDSLRARGYQIAIVEGWRAPHIQERMYRAQWNRWKERRPDWPEIQLKRVVNRFTAPIGYPKAPPPHSTGGAMDVWLMDQNGDRINLHAPFDALDPACYPTDAPGLTREARQARDLLRDALADFGITNYPSEYWHFSFGDQGWAYRGGHPHAIYGPVTPPDWSPDPDDVSDQPIERIYTPK